jgi:hypothetical protein
MQHRAELALHDYMGKALRGKTTVSDKTVKQIAEDVSSAVKRQFGNDTKRGSFKLRMSNVGRPNCQLWFEKNKPELALAKPNNFLMNMMIGDIVEAVFKGLLTEAKIDYSNSKSVSLDLDNESISGTYDIVIDGAVDDIKSASDKANGRFKYISANGIDIDKEVSYINDTVKTISNNKFERCFDLEDELFRGKPTGNKILSKTCSFCDFRFACWKSLVEEPSRVSKAKEPKRMSYVN